jgi:hypothetical protein
MYIGLESGGKYKKISNYIKTIFTIYSNYDIVFIRGDI